jgi:hypothetical protein
MAENSTPPGGQPAFKRFKLPTADSLAQDANMLPQKKLAFSSADAKITLFGANLDARRRENHPMTSAEQAKTSIFGSSFGSPKI